MNKLCCLIIMFFTCGVCEAQNLVPNGDFEQYHSCPTYHSQLDSALYWFNPTTGTPDYYNECGSFLAHVPDNYGGYQHAISGAGYAGIYLQSIFGLNYREYIEVPLLSSLITNTNYHVQFYMSLGDSYCEYTTDDIQIYFSNTSVSQLGFFPLPYTPQISNSSGNYPDTINWTLVSANYLANGGESFMVIGNFKADSLTNLVPYNNSSDALYIFIDDVCVATDSTYCNTSVGINEVNKRDEVVLFPNPFNDKINITVKSNGLIEVSLFDVTARKLLQQKFTNSISINTEQLAKGIYLYEVRNKNGVIKKGKVALK